MHILVKFASMSCRWLTCSQSWNISAKYRVQDQKCFYSF